MNIHDSNEIDHVATFSLLTDISLFRIVHQKHRLNREQCVPSIGKNRAKTENK